MRVALDSGTESLVGACQSACAAPDRMAQSERAHREVNAPVHALADLVAGIREA